MIKKTYGGVKSWVYYSTDFTLVPLLDVKRTGSGVWQWRGDDPQISLLPNKAHSLSGFYMLEVSVVNLKQSVNACLYAAMGCQFNETHAFMLPISRISPGGKVVKRICYFDGFVDSFRFDPSDEQGQCDGLSVKLVKLTQSRAQALMMKKLSKAYNKLSNKVSKESSSRHNNGYTDCITILYEAYDKLFCKKYVGDYKSWIRKQEEGSALSAVAVAAKVDGFSYSPLMSIVCPVYNTKPEWLIACIESVVKQSYSNWELILVDDASTNTTHFDVLRKYSEADKRIKPIFLEENGHISAATNAGINQVSGDYVVFLDHDDALAANALFELCSVINNHPDAKIIYSDEDLISESGERITPHFKSDWNPELLLAHNYITHLCCYEADLLRSLGGLRLGYEGAQDYDLILRASAVVDAGHIYHIPKILYHWRMVEGSTALSSGAKSYATEAGLKALNDYLCVNNILASVDHSSRENFYKVSYLLPEEAPKVSIIIPTRDGLDVLKPCIDTLMNTTAYKNYEIVILDNGSEKQETLNYLKELSAKPNVQVIRDEGEFNYSRINNLAVSHSSGELICLLNNDIEIIDEGWLSEMVSIAVRKDVGCVGAKLLYPDGTIQHAGVILGLGGYAAHSHRGLGGDSPGYFCRAQVRQQLSAVTGACLLIRREVYDAVGGLDETFQVAYNDVDFCLRVQALGYRNIYTPFASLVHHESKTRGEDSCIEKSKRFDQEKALLLNRWSSLIQNDPFYNINLTRAREDFSI